MCTHVSNTKCKTKKQGQKIILSQVITVKCGQNLNVVCPTNDQAPPLHVINDDL